MKYAEEPFNLGMFFFLPIKVSFKMGTFSDPQHIHPVALLGQYFYTRNLILGDGALLFVAYVRLIWALLSQLLGGAAVNQVAKIRGAQISIPGLVLSSSSH